jgi:hypothetical protein
MDLRIGRRLEAGCQSESYIVDVVELDVKAKRMVLQCISGVGSNPVEGRTKI